MITKIFSWFTVIIFSIGINGFSAESSLDYPDDNQEPVHYDLVKISAQEVLSPQNTKQQELATFIREVLDIPIDGENLTNRKSSTDGFLQKAAQTKDFMVVLYNKGTPIGFSRITKLSELIELDKDGKMISFTSRENLTRKGYPLDAGYIIGGELHPSFRRQGHITKVAVLGAEAILKKFLDPDKNLNPYFYIGVFEENKVMNHICQDILKCKLINIQDSSFYNEDGKKWVEYVYSLSKK